MITLDMTQNDLRRILSFNIKFHRKRFLLTQEKLAERAGLSAQTINDIERCRTWVSDKSLIKIAEVLSVAPAELLLSQLEPSVEESGNAGQLKLIRIKSEVLSAVRREIDSVFVRYGIGEESFVSTTCLICCSNYVICT